MCNYTVSLNLHNATKYFMGKSYTFWIVNTKILNRTNHKILCLLKKSFWFAWLHHKTLKLKNENLKDNIANRKYLKIFETKLTGTAKVWLSITRFVINLVIEFMMQIWQLYTVYLCIKKLTESSIYVHLSLVFKFLRDCFPVSFVKLFKTAFLQITSRPLGKELAVHWVLFMQRSIYICYWYFLSNLWIWILHEDLLSEFLTHEFTCVMLSDISFLFSPYGILKY